MDIKKKNSTEQHFVFNQVTLALSISTQISIGETIRRQGQQNTTKYRRNKQAIEKEGTRLISRSNEL